MAREILPSASRKESHASSGGVTSARDVMNYKPPVGPTNITDPKSPGIHGSNHGHARCPVATSGGGSPGIDGTTRRGGSQR